ncbi:Transgelin [Paragonimus heterotremus]|uniref:Calponin n=1 Tax=Paragonimus heterotremus TaxID=100268 RepID=A0A8J4T1J4_9TREM|nr:Transgelin [Paragonimus heterotremus]
MATRVQDYGMDVAISRKLNSRYDPDAERQVIGWINQLTGQPIPPGRENVQRTLKNGQILVNLISTIYDRTANLSPRAQMIRRPIKPTTGNAPFKQMENIQKFLDCSEAYGVPKECLFQTVDLYESRNMAQVLSTLLQLGTECQRNNFQGPVCGPKPTYSNRRQWTEDQLRSGEGIIGLQAGTNKLASQKGMSFGAQRHIADIRCDDMTPEGAAVISLQMGTNKFASQKGMSFSNQRHIADIRCDDLSQEGKSVINLQMGTNQFASQKGMRMGASRHVADIRCDDISKEGQGVINLQYGTNKLASQKGMRMGGQRHIADIRCDTMSQDGASVIGLQMGLSQSQGATQSGMSFGAQRHINDMH